MLRKPVKTRFASIEGTLEAFLRCRVVLLGLVQAPDFTRNLWEASNARERGKREKFISNIESHLFFTKVKEMHNIFRLFRRYLRFFDSDEAKISDVVSKTVALQQDLEKLPLTSFMTSERRADVLGKFERRQNGPINATIKVRLLEDIHFAAHLTDPHRSLRDIDRHINRFRAFLMWYCSGSGTIGDALQLRQNILEQFVKLVEEWNDEKDDAGSENIFKEFEKMPLLYWKSLADRPEYAQLREFAIRTLSVSPSSCPAERSFSLRGRIRTSSRNRMDTAKVKKLAFTHWNMKPLGDSDLIRAGFWGSVQTNEDPEELTETDDEGEAIGCPNAEQGEYTSVFDDGYDHFDISQVENPNDRVTSSIINST